LLTPQQPHSTLFPYTTLFRSGRAVNGQKGGSRTATVRIDGPGDQLLASAALTEDQHRDVLGCDATDRLVHLLHGRAATDQDIRRSEEHTSELQSRVDLVCRLL